MTKKQKKAKAGLRALVLRLVLIASVIAVSWLLLYILIRFLPFPAYTDFRQRNWTIPIYDRHGRLLQVLPVEGGVRREFTPLEKIPPDALELFITSEDKRFYRHWGVDVAAVFRAAAQNIFGGKYISGASTITMQLARIIKPAKNRTGLTKIREAFDALRLESRLSKADILELYLNTVPFGFQVEGLTSASRYFFSLPLADLSREQLCCLAVIPRRPTGYNPLVNPQVCADAAYSLYKAAAWLPADISGAVPPLTREKLNADDFLAAAHSAKVFEYPFYTPHYINYIKNLRGAQRAGSKQTGQLKRTKKGSKQTDFLPPQKLGLNIDLDISLQAEYLLQQKIHQNKNSRLFNGAVLAIENKTGNVLVWVGSNDFFDTAHNGQLDGILTKNQPGSSMKPFLYALALEKGWNPASVLPDIPLRYGSEEVYVPRNFNNRYNGPIRFRVALASSLNVPAVYLLDKIGEQPYLKFLEKLGLTSLRSDGEKNGLALALGSAEVPLIELVAAFSTFPRDGKTLPLRHFQDAPYAEASPVFKKDTARIICSILSDRDARALGFGRSKMFETPFPAIFKTGTANQFQSIVALAASLNYTVGVWMGNFSGQTVIGETGSSVPALIAKNVLLSLENGTAARLRPDTGDKKLQVFPRPEAYLQQKICSLSGMAAGPDCLNTVMEYVPAGLNLERCTWHKKSGNSVSVGYPAEYQEWLRFSRRQANIENASAALRIIRPTEGNCFVYDALYENIHAIPLEIIGGQGDTVNIWYDGSALRQAERPFFIWLPMEWGNHTVKVQCGDETALVNFSVR